MKNSTINRDPGIDSIITDINWLYKRYTRLLEVLMEFRWSDGNISSKKSILTDPELCVDRDTLKTAEQNHNLILSHLNKIKNNPNRPTENAFDPKIFGHQISNLNTSLKKDQISQTDICMIIPGIVNTYVYFVKQTKNDHYIFQGQEGQTSKNIIKKSIKDIVEFNSIANRDQRSSLKAKKKTIGPDKIQIYPMGNRNPKATSMETLKKLDQIIRDQAALWKTAVVIQNIIEEINIARKQRLDLPSLSFPSHVEKLLKSIDENTTKVKEITQKELTMLENPNFFKYPNDPATTIKQFESLFRDNYTQQQNSIQTLTSIIQKHNTNIPTEDPSEDEQRERHSFLKEEFKAGVTKIEDWYRKAYPDKTLAFSKNDPRSPLELFNSRLKDFRKEPPFDISRLQSSFDRFQKHLDAIKKIDPCPLPQLKSPKEYWKSCNAISKQIFDDEPIPKSQPYIDWVSNEYLNTLRKYKKELVEQGPDLVLEEAMGRVHDALTDIRDHLLTTCLDEQKRNPDKKCDRMWSQLSNLLEPLDLEIMDIQKGKTLADSRLHEISETIKGNYPQGVVIEIISLGLRRLSDREVVRKATVIIGESK